MSTVTRVSIIEKPQEKVNVYLDGKLTFTLPLSIGSTLKVNQELSTEEIEQLEKYSDYFTCLNTSKRLIANRPHSRMELKTKLKQKKFAAESIDTALDKLESTGLINDKEFAAYWIENRIFCHPEGRALAAAELRAKGISSDIIHDVLLSINETESAYQSADRVAEKYANLNYREFYKKVSSFLARRGFSYDITRQTTEKLWHKYKTEENESYEYVSD